MKRIFTSCILCLMVIFFAGIVCAEEETTEETKVQVFRDCMEGEDVSGIEGIQFCLEEAGLTMEQRYQERMTKRIARVAERNQDRADRIAARFAARNEIVAKREEYKACIQAIDEDTREEIRAAREACNAIWDDEDEEMEK